MKLIHSLLSFCFCASIISSSYASSYSLKGENKVDLLSNETITTSSCSYEDTCTVSGYEGVCVSVSAGCCPSGTVTSGLCPGSSDIKCCTQSTCSTSYGTGTCMQTSLCSSKGGTSFSGYCTGPSDLQCCVTGDIPVTSGHYGVDVNIEITTTIASCFQSSGIEYVVPRGYRSVGSVDTLVCTSIINAYKIGIERRDVYMFPCKFYSHFSLAILLTI